MGHVANEIWQQHSGTARVTPEATALVDQMAAGRVELAGQFFGHLEERDRKELGDRLLELAQSLATLLDEQTASA